MAFEYKRIDVDSHCQEKPDTWTSRMSKDKWGERIPQIVEKDGREVWMCDGRVMGMGWLCLCHGVIPDRKSLPTHWRDVPSMVYTADGRMRAMDRDGVSAQVLFPNTAGVGGEGFMMRMDPELQKDCVRAYNDYLAEEFYDVAPQRFITLAELPLASVEGAVAELKHAANRGHRGFLMIGATEQYRLPAFADRYWDPLWSTAQDLDMPVHFHNVAGAKRLTLGTEPGASDMKTLAMGSANSFALSSQIFANLLLCGVLERFPKLTFVGAESGIGWVPYVLEACDYEWERNQLYKNGLKRKPSDAFRQQCYVDFWYERAGIELRDFIGIDRILWETDFPHPTSIWPAANDPAAMAKFSESDWEVILAATHAGMTTEAFQQLVRQWLATARDPRFHQAYTALVYKPMLEVMHYLRANGFKTYIVTGGGQEFVRVYSESVYGIPPEHVVGSSILTKYEDQDGKPVLMREPGVFFIDDNAGKPVGINLFIGKRPYAAFGNSLGDEQMLEWTQKGDGARLTMLVMHDDPAREYAYGPTGH